VNLNVEISAVEFATRFANAVSLLGNEPPPQPRRPLRVVKAIDHAGYPHGRFGIQSPFCQCLGLSAALGKRIVIARQTPGPYRPKKNPRYQMVTGAVGLPSQ
jgi:hypothetical protein